MLNLVERLLEAAPRVGAERESEWNLYFRNDEVNRLMRTSKDKKKSVKSVSLE